MAVSPGLKRSRSVCCTARGDSETPRAGVELVARTMKGHGGVRARERGQRDKKIIRQEHRVINSGDEGQEGERGGRSSELIGIVRAENI